jgi:hypothetical protein
MVRTLTHVFGYFGPEVFLDRAERVDTSWGASYFGPFFRSFLFTENPLVFGPSIGQQGPSECATRGWVEFWKKNKNKNKK